ncbi:MAG: CvpA family protein [Anaerolineae bacterium]
MSIFQFVPADLVLIVIVATAIYGFFRGARRELTVTIFIILGYILSLFFINQIIYLINRFYFLLRFALAGGLTAENPAAVLEQVKGISPLISTDQGIIVAQFIVFFTTVFIGWLISRRVRHVLTRFGWATLTRPPDLLARLAGLVAGAINGYLILYYIVSRGIQGIQAVLVVPTFATSLLQQQWLFLIGILLIAVIIVVGFDRARGGRGAGGGGGGGGGGGR